MILGIDGHRLLGQRNGVGRVLEALLRHLARQTHPFEEIRLYSPLSLPADLDLPMPIRQVVFGESLPRSLWQQVALAWAHGQASPLVCPSYVVPLAARCPTLLIHHGSYEGLPGAFSWWRQARARLLHSWSARCATLVVTVSEHSRRDILRFYGVPEEKVVVIPNGVDPRVFYPSRSPEGLASWRKDHLGADVPFVLYVGKPTRRRRLESLTEAFARFLEATSAPHYLVFAGFDLEGTSILETARRRGVASRVISVGHVDQGRLATIYNAAQMMIYPSLYEGFGLPVLEAMACGTPAVALDSSAFREFAQGVALLLPDAEAGTLTEAMVCLARDGAKRREMGRAGVERSRSYSWGSITSRYIEVLAELDNCWELQAQERNKRQFLQKRD